MKYRHLQAGKKKKKNGSAKKAKISLDSRYLLSDAQLQEAVVGNKILKSQAPSNNAQKNVWENKTVLTVLDTSKHRKLY